MKRLRFLSLTLCLVLVFTLFSPLSASAEEMHINAKCALLVDLDHDEVLYDQNAHEKAYPASITKIMTALLTLEAVQQGKLALDTVITVQASALEGLSVYGSTQNIQAGEQMSVENLLYCLLVASANEAANILAEAVSGDVNTFVDLMNERAAELGCTGTHFANTHGLHDDNHYTTAYDIYLIVKAAMEFSQFRTIVSTDEYYVPATNLSEQRHFYSTNYLLSGKKIPGYTYQYATGVKTGTTDEAGHCLVATAEKNGQNMLSVVLGASQPTDENGVPDRQVFTETKRLLEYGFNDFTRQTILDSDQPIQQVAVTLSSEKDYVIVHPAQSVEVSLPTSADLSKLEQNVQLPESVEAPIAAGQVIGTLTLTLDGVDYGTVDLVAEEDISRSTLLFYRKQISDFFAPIYMKILAVVVIVALIVLLVRVTLFRKQRRYGSRRGGFGRSHGYRGRRRR